MSTSRIDTVTLWLETGPGEWVQGKGEPPTLLRPTQLAIEWRNGYLHRCTLRGPRVRPNGTEYPTGEWAGANYMQTHREKGGAPLGLRKDTPAWVAELVDHYARDRRVTKDPDPREEP